MLRADFSVLTCTLYYFKVILCHLNRVFDRDTIKIRIYRQNFRERKKSDNEFVLNR